jgi:hypothetical protein
LCNINSGGIYWRENINGGFADSQHRKHNNAQYKNDDRYGLTECKLNELYHLGY